MVAARTLNSARNPLLKEIRRALRRGEPADEGLCAIEGRHLLAEAGRSRLEIAAVFGPEEFSSYPGFVQVPDHVLADIATTETSPGVIALVRIPVWPLDALYRAPALTVLLDGLQDAGNAGTILRSAEAFGASGVVFGHGTVSRWNSKVLRASAGSIFRIPTIAHDLRGLPGPLYAASPREGTSLESIDWTAPSSIVIGSEAHGIQPELARQAIPVRIATQTVESLNAAVAASIILHEAFRQRISV